MGIRGDSSKDVDSATEILTQHGDNYKITKIPNAAFHPEILYEIVCCSLKNPEFSEKEKKELVLKINLFYLKQED